MYSLPRWYLPQGVDCPDHIPTTMRTLTTRLLDGVGPDAVDGAFGGGTVIGGEYQRGEIGWTKTLGGWWINFTAVAPQVIGRIKTHPRIIRWASIPGANDGHWWQAPVLLSPFKDDDGNPIAYQSALDQHWNGAAWVDAADLEPLQERLRQVAINVGNGQVKSDADLFQLVSDILLLGHYLHPHDLAASGWLTKAVLLRVLITAADVPSVEFT